MDACCMCMLHAHATDAAIVELAWQWPCLDGSATFRALRPLFSTWSVQGGGDLNNREPGDPEWRNHAGCLLARTCWGLMCCSVPTQKLVHVVGLSWHAVAWIIRLKDSPSSRSAS